MIKILEDKDNIYYWNGIDRVPEDVVNVVIEDGVTEIGVFEFRNHESLRSITIPKSVNYIGWHAFVDCTSLTDVKILGNPKIYEDAFKGTPVESKIKETKKKKEIDKKSESREALHEDDYGIVYYCPFCAEDDPDGDHPEDYMMEAQFDFYNIDYGLYFNIECHNCGASGTAIETVDEDSIPEEDTFECPECGDDMCINVDHNDYGELVGEAYCYNCDKSFDEFELITKYYSSEVYRN